jgi:hypothetical protein
MKRLLAVLIVAAALLAGGTKPATAHTSYCGVSYAYRTINGQLFKDEFQYTTGSGYARYRTYRTYKLIDTGGYAYWVYVHTHVNRHCPNYV